MKTWSWFLILTCWSVMSLGCKTSGKSHSAVKTNRDASQARKGPFVLVTPTKIEKKAGEIRLTYNAPCDAIDFSSLVIHGNDSGDLTSYLGVVYDSSKCRNQTVTKHTHLVASSEEDYKILTEQDVTIKPMKQDSFVLVGPDAVTRSGNAFEVSVTVPCKSLDFESYVLSNDDSGDMILSLGVVYNRAYCQNSSSKQLKLTIQKENEEALFEEMTTGGGEVMPMKVSSAGEDHASSSQVNPYCVSTAKEAALMFERLNDGTRSVASVSPVSGSTTAFDIKMNGSNPLIRQASFQVTTIDKDENGCTVASISRPAVQANAASTKPSPYCLTSAKSAVEEIDKLHQQSRQIVGAIQAQSSTRFLATMNKNDYESGTKTIQVVVDDFQEDGCLVQEITLK